MTYCLCAKETVGTADCVLQGYERLSLPGVCRCKMWLKLNLSMPSHEVPVLLHWRAER